MNRNLFIWIPKTSGTSFYESYRLLDPTFVKQLDGKKILNGTHGHYSIKEIYDPQELQDFNIFTIVRNPFSRAISLYEYLKKQNLFPKNKSFSLFLETIMKGVPPVGPYNRVGLSQCNPQKDWINSITDVKIYRMEDRARIEEDFGLSPRHVNRSVYLNYKAYYDDRTIKMVREIYKEDFLFFDYPLELE